MVNFRNFDDLRSFLSSSTSLKVLQDGLEVNEYWAPSSIVEWLQEELQSSAVDELYRKRCTKCLNALVKKYQVFPSSFFCDNVRRDGDYPLGGGGFADVYKGVAGNRMVCLKVLRVHTQPDEKKRKKMVEDFCQEALIWTQLSHPNVLQLLGVNTTLFKTDFCLVSPWMVNNDIITFLGSNPNHDRLRSIREIAAGLDYLHSLSPMIVHGDIRGANILVDEDCNCRLADFGLSKEAHGTTMIETSTGGMKGSLRWMAPEMFQLSTDSNEDRSPRDIYAYACTILEIMTGRPPFPNLLDVTVMTQILLSHARPGRPTGVWCPDNVWQLVEKCWDQDRLKRPTSRHIHNYLTGLIEADTSLGAEPSLSVTSYLEAPIQIPPFSIPQPALERMSNEDLVNLNPTHAQPTHDHPSPDIPPAYMDGNTTQKNAHLNPRARSRSITRYLTKLVPNTSSAITPPQDDDHSHREQSSSSETAPVTSPDRRPGLRSGIQNYFTKLVPTSKRRYSIPAAIARSFDDHDPFEDVLKPPPDETPEQAAERIARETEAKRVSDAIDEELKKEVPKRERRKGVKGLLLVGQAGSGKTTVFKNLVAHYDSAAWDKEKSIWCMVIQLNIISLLLDVVELIQTELQVLDSKEDDKHGLKTHSFSSHHELLINPLQPLRDLIAVSPIQHALAEHVKSNWKRDFLPVSDPDVSLERSLRRYFIPFHDRYVSVERSNVENAFKLIVANKDSVKALWKDENVQHALNRRTRLGSTGFYFEDLDRVASPDYYPTDEDVLHAYLPTSGYQDFTIPINTETALQITDIGGRRGQRWVLDHTILDSDHYNMIVFLFPLSTFDEALEEDYSVNHLEDTMIFWRAICSMKILSTAKFIVFLNKYDLLEQKLQRGVSIKKYITSYGSRPNESLDFVNYVTRHVKAVYKKASPSMHTRTLHVFTTTATDKATLKPTLEKAILKHVYDRNLQESTNVL